MSKKIALIIATSVLLLTVNFSVLFAHGLVSSTESGKLTLTYDDGKPVAEGFVTVYDKEGKEIASGKTDAKGVFDYSQYDKAAQIIAADSFGHQCVHTIGQNHATQHHHVHEHEHPGGQRTVVVLGVALALCAFSALFYRFSDKTRR